MDAKTRELLRRAQTTGAYLDYLAYLQALRRAGEFTLAGRPPDATEYIDSDARLELCARRYLTNNVDLFLNFLRFQYGDLSTLFTLPGRRIVFGRIDPPPAGATPEVLSQFVGRGFILFDASIMDGLGTFVGFEAECQQFEIAVIDFLSQFGEEWDGETMPCLTLHEIENIFGIANCLAPTLSRSAELNWRGRALGDVEYSIVSGLTERTRGDPRYRQLRLVKLGVLIPRWHNDTYFTTDDIIEPGRPPAFIFEVRTNRNEPYWGIYYPFIPYVAPGEDRGVYDPFIVEHNVPLLQGELTGGTLDWSPIILIDAPEMPQNISRSIRDALGAVELPADGAILWLPPNMPRTPPPVAAPPNLPECPACDRLKPYNRLCRRHAPRI